MACGLCRAHRGMLQPMAGLTQATEGRRDAGSSDGGPQDFKLACWCGMEEGLGGRFAAQRWRMMVQRQEGTMPQNVTPSVRDTLANGALNARMRMI